MSGNLLLPPQPVVDTSNPLVPPTAAVTNNDPLDFTGRYNTALSPSEELQFQQWLRSQSAAAGRDMSRDLADYDWRGFWKAGAELDPETGHGGDTYKKPSHPTFSTFSKYHGQDGYQGGVWAGGQNGAPWTFTPSKTNLQMMPLPLMQRYFASPAESDSVLIVPNQ